MIFNVVVDTVIWHWFSVVTPMEGVLDPETEGFLQKIQWMTAYFYAGDGLLASTWEKQLQRSFNVLMELFYRVGMHTNVGKMVSMVCQPCH